MTDFLYDANGNAVGYVLGKYIHAMDDTGIGQIRGTHVHKTTGEYVGELEHEMVLNKHFGNPGSIGYGSPANSGSRGNPGNRGARNPGFEDVFEELLED